MNTLSGKQIASEIRQRTTEAAESFRAKGIVPTLAVVVATDDPQTAWYVRSISKAAEGCGITATIIDLGQDATTQKIADCLKSLAQDPHTHGIILQTPLPKSVDADMLTTLIPPEKDVDGVSSVSAGRIIYDLPGFAPATAEAAITILEQYNVPLDGAHVVVVGRSRVVGRPVALLLLQKNATVTICHSHTQNMKALTTQADVLVVAAGKAGLITNDHVREGATVIDVGTNVTSEGQLIGDVAPTVAEKASLTPVPGGVGPVTSALILWHTVLAVGHTPST